MVQSNNEHKTHAFLPQDDEIVLKTTLKDVENSTIMSDITEFNPFEERKIDNPTTDCQTLTHLLKSTLGTGILSMPYAFKSSGIVGGVLLGLLMAAVCTHTSYILVKCAHILYYRTQKTKMDYADVVEVAFATGPKWSAKYSKPARYFLQVWLFLTYFTACSADNIIIATNFGQVFRYYMNYESLAASNNTGVNNATGINNTDIINVTETINSTIVSELVMAPIDESQLRIIMGFVLLPLILLVWVPDLKYLAPISMLANIFMACVIGITCFYLVQDMKSISDLTLFQPITRAPQFICITLFAMENIGVIMPLENNMKKPKNFLGAYGVLNRGMSSITLVYLIVGILGYMKYGENVSPIITTNLPVTHIAAQIVKILIGLTILFAFSLQFYVCRDMVWTRTKKYFPSKPFLAEYIIRTLLVVACVSVAIIFPKIGPLVTLIGALGFSLLGIFGPVIIEIVTFWDIGFGRYYWMISKNILLMLFGILSLVFGSYSAVEEITRDLLDKK